MERKPSLPGVAAFQPGNCSWQRSARVVSLEGRRSRMTRESREDRVRILRTSDDGVYAAGLRALGEELRKLGDVTVVAPATEQSGVGHSITLLTPLLVQEVLDDQRQFLGWAVEGR